MTAVGTLVGSDMELLSVPNLFQDIERYPWFSHLVSLDTIG